jgi:hypothetical protein
MRVGSRNYRIIQWIVAFGVLVSVSLYFWTTTRDSMSKSPVDALDHMVTEYENGRYKTAFDRFRSKSKTSKINPAQLGSLVKEYYSLLGVSPRVQMQPMEYNNENQTRKDYKILYKNFQTEDVIYVTMFKTQEGYWVTDLSTLTTFLINFQAKSNSFQSRRLLASAMRKLGMNRLYRDEARYTTPDRLDAFADGKIDKKRLFTLDESQNPL